MGQQGSNSHQGDRTEGHSSVEPDEVLDGLNEDNDVISTAATVAVVGAGVILFEAALLPGLVLGIATMMVPKFLPRLGAAVNPLVKSTIRGAYKMGQKTREAVAEAREQVHDIVAEVDAEADGKAATLKPSARETA